MSAVLILEADKVVGRRSCGVGGEETQAISETEMRSSREGPHDAIRCEAWRFLVLRKIGVL